MKQSNFPVAVPRYVCVADAACGIRQSRDEVCQLLCLLTKDNLSATLELNELITGRVRLALSGAMSSAGVAAAVRHEMALLSAAVQKEDSCWEHRLRSAHAGGTRLRAASLLV